MAQSNDPITITLTLTPEAALSRAQEVLQACMALDELLPPSAAQKALSGLHELLTECMDAMEINIKLDGQ